MSWADRAKAALRRGETVTVRPRGHSMRPKVNDGDLVTLVPCLLADLAVGSIVLVRVGGNDYLHLVTAIDAQRMQIGNNRGRINGWVGPAAIYGRAVKVEA
ncbi:MAG: S24/S26 family peptidase [Planctomycetes bacterium]|nr:S24/S26 family peptidase [Planctomycetota bacterium]MCC7397641.1 S24/S26 family peptidase [Planctomycetota bacterium]